MAPFLSIGIGILWICILLILAINGGLDNITKYDCVELKLKFQFD